MVQVTNGYIIVVFHFSVDLGDYSKGKSNGITSYFRGKTFLPGFMNKRIFQHSSDLTSVKYYCNQVLNLKPKSNTFQIQLRPRSALLSMSMASEAQENLAPSVLFPVFILQFFDSKSLESYVVDIHRASSSTTDNEIQNETPQLGPKLN